MTTFRDDRPRGTAPRSSKRARAARAVALCGLLAVTMACGNSRGGPGGAEDSGWFPLVPDARWTYDGHFEGTTYRNTLALRPIRVDDRTTYGFYDIGEKIEGQLLMGNMFGDELFRREGDVLYVADEHSPDDEHVLLRFPLREGETTEYRVGSRVTRTAVRGEEQVTVPAGTFECRRLAVVVEYDSGKVSRHDVWLARGVGLVKWKRSTGRLDELVHYAIR